MHELSIMGSALELALDRAQQAGATRVRVIRLRIGVLSGVVPEALQFAFETLTANTPAQGGLLEIEQIPARFGCPRCRKEYEVNAPYGECPNCGEVSSDLRAGREMELTSLDIE